MYNTHCNSNQNATKVINSGIFFFSLAKKKRVPCDEIGLRYSAILAPLCQCNLFPSEQLYTIYVVGPAIEIGLRIYDL